jgi:hypothetical protein
MSVAPVQELRPELDLTGLIREHVEASDDLDPRVIAAAIVAALPNDLLREALRATLPDRVRAFHRHRRNVHGSPGSRRWNGIRDVADELAIFRRAVAIGPADWRALGSLVRDQVLMVAEDRRLQARATDAQADRFEKLAALMKRRRAKVVSDLSPAEVAEVLDA